MQEAELLELTYSPFTRAMRCVWDARSKSRHSPGSEGVRTLRRDEP
jgi:hypothetical protein